MKRKQGKLFIMLNMHRISIFNLQLTSIWMLVTLHFAHYNHDHNHNPINRSLNIVCINARGKLEAHKLLNVIQCFSEWKWKLHSGLNVECGMWNEWVKSFNRAFRFFCSQMFQLNIRFNVSKNFWAFFVHYMYYGHQSEILFIYLRTNSLALIIIKVWIEFQQIII